MPSPPRPNALRRRRAILSRMSRDQALHQKATLMSQAVSRDVATPSVETARDSRGTGRLLRPLLMVLGAAIILVGGARFWLGNGGGFSTDDAYVRAAKLS